MKIGQEEELGSDLEQVIAMLERSEIDYTHHHEGEDGVEEEEDEDKEEESERGEGSNGKRSLL